MSESTHQHRIGCTRVVVVTWRMEHETWMKAMWISVLGTNWYLVLRVLRMSESPYQHRIGCTGVVVVTNVAWSMNEGDDRGFLCWALRPVHVPSGYTLPHLVQWYPWKLNMWDIVSQLTTHNPQPTIHNMLLWSAILMCYCYEYNSLLYDRTTLYNNYSTGSKMSCRTRNA